MYKIIVAEDDHDLRRDFVELLDEQDDFEVVADVSNGHDAVLFTEQLEPDLIVMDIEMPIMTGIEAAKRIKEKNLRTNVLIVTAFQPEVFVKTALIEGPFSYILKGTAIREFLSHVKTVAKGGIVFGPSVSETVKKLTPRLSEEPATKKLERNLGITEKHAAVLALLLEGKSNQEIAAELGNKLKSVQNNISDLKSDLACDTKETLIALAKDSLNT